MSILINEIIDILENCTGFPRDAINASIVVTPSIELGDYGSNLSFRIAKGGETSQVAKSLAKCANESPKRRFLVAKSYGSFVTFSIADESFYTNVLNERSPISAKPNGKKIIIETAPANIGEEFNLLHYRATCIANLLAKVYRHLGYDVNMLLFWNDCGTPAGRLLYAYQKWGDQMSIRIKPKSELRRLRNLFAAASYDENKVIETARELSLQLEHHDPKIDNIWRELREIHLRALVQDYGRFNLFYDEIIYESQNEDLVVKIKDSLLTSGIAQVDKDESIIANLAHYKLPVAILFRSDGASLYTIRDVAELIRRRQLGFNQNIYVVSRNQIGHFDQVFKLVSFLKEYHSDSGSSIHVPFGLVNGGKLNLEETISILEDTAYHQVRYATSERQKRITARIISEAILKSELLNRRRITDVTLTIEALSDIRTTSGLYLLYSTVRANKLLKHCEVAQPNNMGIFPLANEEKTLIKCLDRRQLAFEETIAKNEPNEIVKYALEVCAKFNQFYDSCPITVNGFVSRRRLAVVEAFQSTMETLLEFMGVQIPEEI